jgi:hypothetical protein
MENSTWHVSNYMQMHIKCMFWWKLYAFAYNHFLLRKNDPVYAKIEKRHTFAISIKKINAHNKKYKMVDSAYV